MAEDPTTIPPELADLLRTPFDTALADPTRLRIQAALHGLPTTGSIRFTALARALGLSDGNLAAHLGVLGEVGYVATSHTWTGRRRTTWYQATGAGREAFTRQVEALRTIAEAGAGGS